MATHIAVEWIHVDPRETEEPVMLYSELDGERWETRKVHVWEDGSTAWADQDHEVRTFLSELPLPLVDDIEGSGEFRAREITASEFEAIWERRDGPIPTR